MKLTKDNKHSVTVGDILKFSEKESYMIRTVVPYNNGICFSLQDTKTKQVIYCYPSSKCYGTEIIKQ